MLTGKRKLVRVRHGIPGEEHSRDARPWMRKKGEQSVSGVAGKGRLSRWGESRCCGRRKCVKRGTSSKEQLCTLKLHRSPNQRNITELQKKTSQRGRKKNCLMRHKGVPMEGVVVSLLYDPRRQMGKTDPEPKGGQKTRQG